MSAVAMLKTLNLALRFILELCGLVAVGYWGFKTGNGRLMEILLGIGGPLAVAVLWGMIGSPNAPYPLSPALHLLLELVVFGLPVLLLFFTKQPLLGVVYGIAVVANKILMTIWGQ